MTGTAFARRVERLLSRAGSTFGAGELTGQLRRVTGRSGPPNAPTGETVSTYDFVCIWAEFEAEERQAGLVEDGDSKLLIGADSLKVVPRTSDTVTVQGRNYRVKRVDVVEPGGVALLFELIVRT